MPSHARRRACPAAPASAFVPGFMTAFAPALARAFAATLAIAAALVLPAAAARAEVPSLYLVQNSGWMEPFFADRASPFKPLLSALVDASHTGRTIIADFSQDGQVPGRRSPQVDYDGPFAPAPVHAAIDALALAVRPGGRLADADFDGALVRSLDTVLAGKPGIVWIVTNNKNSPNNSAEIDRNTRGFAELVRSSDALPFVAAYPVRMPVTGRQYTERGLIIYAIAYGDEAAAVLSRTVDAAPMRALFTDPPFRLKHLEQAPLAFTVTGADAPVAASILPDGGILLRGVPSGGDATVRVAGTLRSEYYPQTIVAADVALAWSALDGVADPRTLAAAVEPQSIRHLASDAGQDVTLALHTPAVPRPPGLAGLFAQTRVLRGTLSLRLDNLSMALGEDFAAKMGDIAALDQLPDVFADYQKVTAATAVLPVTLAVHFSPLPLIAALAAAALTLLALAAALLVLARARQYSVPMDGRSRSFALRPMQSRTVALADGRALVVTGRLFGPHRHAVLDRPRKPPR